MPVSLDDTTSKYTAFRLAEKHYKNRSVKGKFPSLRLHQDSLIDLSRPISKEDDPVWLAGWWSPFNESDDFNHSWKPWNSSKGKERDKGERPDIDTSGMKQIQLADGKQGWVVAPGCILIPQYLSVNDQLNLVHSSLAEYTLPPNPLSLSTHYDVPKNLFELYATEPNSPVMPKYLISSAEIHSTQPPRSRPLIETEPASVLGYEEILARNKTWTGDAPSDKLKEKTVLQLMTDMRWANLGLIYQWTTKSYDFGREESIPFPKELAELCHTVVAAVPWAEVNSDQSPTGSSGWKNWPNDYKPDTGIVNFYQVKDTLMGHVDRSELDPARPLVSLSLGHCAILLLGSASRHDPPRPIILRSGDCLVMSGEGRQAYHGVPRIMDGTLPSHFSPLESDTVTMRAAKQFISSARININARQVFPPGFERPVVMAEGPKSD
ncbi:alkylated DNA repair protein AlkB [Kwoniella shivajii]|uniref:Alkylated DNA repair protein AlkB n=1 Tax=Kwoniella shivajii TaxID=564305 RepID=A0ABZ1CR97_9TREE|nr:alkylated DNA repair protein AlkB [Kwoniella shivajii]